MQIGGGTQRNGLCLPSLPPFGLGNVEHTDMRTQMLFFLLSQVGMVAMLVNPFPQHVLVCRISPPSSELRPPPTLPFTYYTIELVEGANRAQISAALESNRLDIRPSELSFRDADVHGRQALVS